MASTSPGSLDLIIRFAITDIPDIPLRLSSPLSASVHSLKRELRAHLLPDVVDRGLRLIHGGRVLEDGASVADALRWKESMLLPHIGQGEAGGKGKEKEATPVALLSIPPTYIHCAISTFSLSPAELAAEHASSFSLPSNSTSCTRTPNSSGQNPQQLEDDVHHLGFDRLLSTAGFTVADVISLRAQYRAMITSRYTTDTMPSPRTLLTMEERWLESSPANTTSVSGVTPEIEGQTITLADDEDDAARSLDDNFYGVMMGFFWPFGAAVWGLREEGVWSKRRQLAVLVGIGINLGMGFLRLIN